MDFSMQSSMSQEQIKSLVPVLSERERQEMLDYFTVAEKYNKEMTARFMEELKDHPVFGSLIRDIPKEVNEERNKISRQMQHDAIVDGKWDVYVQFQIGQGMMYAKMGFSFYAWFEIIAMARDYLIPYLQKEYSGEKLLGALNGLNRFMDIGMCVIGEAYLEEKKQIIREDQEKIKQLNEELERKVIERTAELEAVNKELEAFTYSVSHDLRAPLRAINGYAEMLGEDYKDKLDEDGKRIMSNISHNATKMGTLIDDLLAFSRLGRKEIQKTLLDMNELVEGVMIEMNKSVKHHANVQIHPLHNVKADYALIHQAMYNLISNGIKYSSQKKNPIIEVSSQEMNGEIIYTVKDNGAGFDMKYANKLFGVFQRLHSQEEFDGTGVGLAIVQRVIAKQGGRVWAEGKVNEGATFHFSLKKLTL